MLMNIISYQVTLQSQHLEYMKQLQMSPPMQRGLAFPDTVSRYQILLQQQDQHHQQPREQNTSATDLGPQGQEKGPTDAV